MFLASCSGAGLVVPAVQHWQVCWGYIDRGGGPAAFFLPLGRSSGSGGVDVLGWQRGLGVPAVHHRGLGGYCLVALRGGRILVRGNRSTVGKLGGFADKALLLLSLKISQTLVI